MFNVYYLYTDTAYEIAATESDMNSNYLQLYYKAVTSPQINYYIDGTLSKTSWDEGVSITLYQPTVGVNLIFDGWYLDADYTTPASAKDIVDGENNLYGRIVKENESDSMVTVNISLGSVDWNSGEVEYEEYIAVAGAFNAETISSTALNQALVSSFYFYIEYIYYTDDTYTTLYNFDSELSGDITLYCKAIGHFIVIVVSEDGTVVDGNTDVQLAMIIQNEGQSYDDALAFYGLTLYELNDAGEKVLATELVHFGYYYFSETIFFDIEQEGTRVPVAAQAGATLEQALLCTMYLDVLENGAFYTDVTYTTVIDNNTVVTDGGVYYFDSY